MKEYRRLHFPAPASGLPMFPHSSCFRFLRFALLSAAVATSFPPVSRAESPPVKPEEQVFFSFDDESLPWRDNLHLTLVAPKKYEGNPVLKHGPQGAVDANGALLYGTVFQDGGKYRMWYIGQPQPDPKFPEDTNPPHRPVCYAESTDGIHWDKPNLGLVSFCGSKDNNIVSIEPADHPFARMDDFVSVLRDETDPDPARRYKMVYIAYQPQLKHSAAVRCVSPDGLHWKLASTEEFTKGHFENTSLIKFNGLYYVTGQNLGRAGGHLADGQDAGRAMTAFFSPDFQHWSNGRALSFFRSGYEQKPESLGQELHMGAGLWNRGNVILGLYGRWHGDHIDTVDPEHKKTNFLYDLKIDLGFVVSNDAIHYREPIQNFVMVAPGPDDAWDAKAILQAQAFANTDTETYIWYSQWYTRNPAKAPPVPGPTIPVPFNIGLLTLRRDGFGYLSKHVTEIPAKPSPFLRKDTAASVLSKSVTLPFASTLLLNVDKVSPDAPFQVSLVDDAEQPLPGFAPVAVTKSGVRVPVPIGEHGIPTGLKFRVKVQWPDGTANPHFYALYFQPQ